MYFVYILSLSTGDYYKGITDNINRRVKQHSLGKVDATKNKLPIRLIHVEVVNSRVEARVLEKYFKSGYGREIIQEVADIMIV